MKMCPIGYKIFHNFNQFLKKILETFKINQSIDILSNLVTLKVIEVYIMIFIV